MMRVNGTRGRWHWHRFLIGCENLFWYRGDGVLDICRKTRRCIGRRGIVILQDDVDIISFGCCGEGWLGGAIFFRVVLSLRCLSPVSLFLGDHWMWGAGCFFVRIFFPSSDLKIGR